MKKLLAISLALTALTPAPLFAQAQTAASTARVDAAADPAALGPPRRVTLPAARGW
jgi:hypothetical protein